MEQKENTEIQKKIIYDRIYKPLLIVPAILLIFSIFYLVNFNAKNGDIIYKDVSLTGGTILTVFDNKADVKEIKNSLKEKFLDINVREISDIRTGKQHGFFVETKAEADEIKKAVEEILGYELKNENSSIEFTGSSLSASFYQQLRLAIVIAFILMAIVVFIVFRSFAPSLAVILAAFADIVMTIVVVDMIGINISAAGIIAFLMLIGYSVDTDVLLTTRVLRNHEGTINERIFGAFKTGMTMTLTSIAAAGVAFFIVYGLSDTLRQIFGIILIGLGFDIFNTWITNASILKWYAENKK
ncbi:MAG: protein translocase subunit SecF [Nanoarchaeota archaeon]